MLYDLNVAWSATQTPQELERAIYFLSELGYDSLALNHTITGALPSQLVNPIPATQPFSIPAKTSILRRCTLVISDPSLNHRLPALAGVYDILALRPTTEKAFLAACLTLTDHSIISLDLTQRYPFHFKPKPLMTAVNRGLRFEISYAQATLGDSTARRNFISNVLGILRATSGRGLIVSSQAGDVLGVRAPADVVNLLGVWGLGRERALESLGVNPRGVLVNEGIKRTAYRGVVNVVDGGEALPIPKELKENTKKAVTAGKPVKNKRKVDDNWANSEGVQTISKRQAKKLRLDALKAERESSSSAQNTNTGDMSSEHNGLSTTQTTESG
ncbi:ribonuclease P protein subunit 3 [Phlyctema vagabunda]|uniref:Ribonuclease P protein subunit 3 n=1 Tax=Phlyctema vagabunda TaxID=108571 RepID=A0ABR4PFU3_9HELO